MFSLKSAIKRLTGGLYCYVTGERMNLQNSLMIEIITLEECELIFRDISRTLKKPIDCIIGNSSLVILMDDTVMNIWPGPEINMRFDWDNDHPVDSLKYTCSNQSGRFEIGYVLLRNNRITYFELKGVLLNALIGTNPNH